MFVERFPRRAYMKRLRQLNMELQDWQRKYKRMAAYTESEALAGRLQQRANILDAAAVDVQLVVERLDELPRLS